MDESRKQGPQRADLKRVSRGKRRRSRRKVMESIWSNPQLYWTIVGIVFFLCFAPTPLKISEARRWPTTTATVEPGSLEHYGKTWVNTKTHATYKTSELVSTFSITYQVNGSVHHFNLRSDGPMNAANLKVGDKTEIHYNRWNPSESWLSISPFSIILALGWPQFGLWIFFFIFYILTHSYHSRLIISSRV